MKRVIGGVVLFASIMASLVLFIESYGYNEPTDTPATVMDGTRRVSK